MKKILENEEYDTSLESSDWRYSAAALGLYKYFKYFEKDHLSYKLTSDCLFYNSKDLTEERYLEFVEYYYKDNLHHIYIENKLCQETFTEEEIKLINEKLVANTVLKNVFKKIKFDGTNQNEILKLICENRKKIVKETFTNKKDMYANYCNKNCLGQIKNDCCRLSGYYVDINKKGKSVSYNFNKTNYVFEDEVEFDFIPFAFSGVRESFFINDSISLKELIKTNSTYKLMIEERKEDKKLDSRKVLFKAIIESNDFIDYDIEVIIKNQDNEFFETLYIRKENIEVLRKITDFYDAFCFSIKITDDYWINVQKEVINCILNNIRTDKLINRFLKNNENEFVVSRLIKVNILMDKGGKDMEKKTKIAYACAKEVAKSIPENKLISYRQKLTSAIVFNDYDRVCEILLQLSNYSNVDFDFAYDLFEDFEKNKDVAYSFINALTKKKENKEAKVNE